MNRSRIAAALVLALLIPAVARAEGESITLPKPSVTGGKQAEANLVVRTPGSSSTSYRISLTGPVFQQALELTLPAGATSARFTISTTAVPVATKVMICASSHPPACDATARLDVLAPRLESLQFGTTTVTSGTALQGTVTLDGPAPAGGFEVDLAQSPPPSQPLTVGACVYQLPGAVAPDTVLIPAGLSSKAFTIPTYHLDRQGELLQQVVVVAARAAGIEKSQTLTVKKLRFSTFTIQPPVGPRPLNVTASFSLNGPAASSLLVEAHAQNTAQNSGQTTLSAGQQSGSFPMVIENGKTPVVIRLGGACLDSNNTTATVDLLPPL